MAKKNIMTKNMDKGFRKTNINTRVKPTKQQIQEMKAREKTALIIEYINDHIHKNKLVTIDDVKMLIQNYKVKQEVVFQELRKHYGVIKETNQIVPKRLKPTKPLGVHVYSKSIYDHVCYRFLTITGEIIYVGRAENLINRLKSHANSGHLSALCYNSVYKVEYCKFESEDDLDIAERYYIAKYQPEYNVDFKNKKYFTISELDNKQWKEYSAGARILKK